MLHRIGGSYLWIALTLASSLMDVQAAAGRMAPTNHLTRSLVFATIFYNLGLYGRVGAAMGLLPTVALSVWWLRRFRFGPMEWLWRTLTYGRLRPTRLHAAPAGAR